MKPATPLPLAAQPPHSPLNRVLSAYIWTYSITHNQIKSNEITQIKPNRWRNLPLARKRAASMAISIVIFACKVIFEAGGRGVRARGSVGPRGQGWATPWPPSLIRSIKHNSRLWFLRAHQSRHEPDPEPKPFGAPGNTITNKHCNKIACFCS